MSFSLLCSWDNRKRPVRIDPQTGNSWTRRIRRFEGDGLIKLKLEDGSEYREVLVDQASCKIIWDRFKQGQSIDDCVSILANPVPKSLQSRKEREKNSP